MRQRVVKPEFFRHRGLYDLERKTGLPIRVAFEGLWCAADREGRFRWRPDSLKLDILPWDDLDFAAVLDALLQAGFISKFKDMKGRECGLVPTFLDHQNPHKNEAKSELIPSGSGNVGTLLEPSRNVSECPPESESELVAESESESHTEYARASDAEVQAHWTAYCEGTGRDLPYDIQTAELLQARSPDPATTRAAAERYAGSLSPGIKPSPARFAGKVAEWIAEAKARDKPRLSARERANLEAVQAVIGRKATG